MDHQQEAPMSAYPAVNERNITCTAAPPPVGYPTKDDFPSQQAVPIKTTSRGLGPLSSWQRWLVYTLILILTSSHVKKHKGTSENHTLTLSSFFQ
ncbi:hypothetical protein Fmac_018678 [Flemingia macrophylla]|uniref:Uncharacterized protein n=1 Tax=Flemingia macrophylla TaxID=520843 RepID=A0ABD1M634_9FABA